MRDRVGQVWLVILFTLIAGVSLWLWINGQARSGQAEETYLAYAAARILGCQPYGHATELKLDLNRDGVREYFFSCDSSLASIQMRYVVMQINKKSVQILLHVSDGKWLVGEGPEEGAGHWLVDRREQVLVFVSKDGIYYRPVWKRKEKYIQLVAE